MKDCRVFPMAIFTNEAVKQAIPVPNNVISQRSDKYMIGVQYLAYPGEYILCLFLSSGLSSQVSN